MDESIVKHLVPADLDEVSRLLLRAADLIETRGHCKMAMGSAKEGFCVMAAVLYARFRCEDWDGMNVGDPDYQEAFERLTKAGAWVDWNNAPERTKEEVVAKLRAVALGG